MGSTVGTWSAITNKATIMKLLWRSIQQHYNELRVSVFVRCPIGAIDSTYKWQKISKSLLTIFVKLSGFLGDTGSRSQAKNWENPFVRISGSGWERKKFTPHFLPPGGSGCPQIFWVWGSPGALHNFHIWRPSDNNWGQEAGLTILKNFDGRISGRALGVSMYLREKFSLLRFIED